jgi:hypothetical protein
VRDALTRQQYEATAAIARHKDEASNLQFLADKQRQVVQARDAEVRSLQERVAALLQSLGPEAEVAAAEGGPHRNGAAERGRGRSTGSRGSSRGGGGRRPASGSPRSHGEEGKEDAGRGRPHHGSSSAAAFAASEGAGAVASELMDVIRQLQGEVRACAAWVPAARQQEGRGAWGCSRVLPRAAVRCALYLASCVLLVVTVRQRSPAAQARARPCRAPHAARPGRALFRPPPSLTRRPLPSLASATLDCPLPPPPSMCSSPLHATRADALRLPRKRCGAAWRCGTRR